LHFEVQCPQPLCPLTCVPCIIHPLDESSLDETFLGLHDPVIVHYNIIDPVWTIHLPFCLTMLVKVSADFPQKFSPLSVGTGVVLRDFSSVVQCPSIETIRPCLSGLGVRTHRSGSILHLFHGTFHPRKLYLRDDSSKGRINQEKSSGDTSVGDAVPRHP
jgi:hypothetical protein